MKYIYYILLIFVFLLFFLGHNRKETFYLYKKNKHENKNKKKFTYLLKLRRKLERVEGIKHHIEINKDNIEQLKKKYNDYFFILIDSGCRGSKNNSDIYIKNLRIPIIDRYYFGPLEKLKEIPEQINDFVIKPYNLSNSDGLLLVKDKKDTINNKNFKSNSDIINYYKNDNSLEKTTNIIVQKYINSEIRPDEIKVYSFNGISPMVLFIKWKTSKKNSRNFYKVLNNDWELLRGENLERPKVLDNIISDSNKITKSLGTFLRIDYLLDKNHNDYYFCETSSYPLCALEAPNPEASKFHPQDINKLLYKYWFNCFPFNKYTVEEVEKKTKHYNKKEPCEKN